MNNIREDRIRLGKYVLGRALGTGSFGKVKLAEHILTNQLVAIKILNRKHMANNNVTQKVFREARILQKFNHPHIVRLYDVIETPSDLFLVLEYCSNGELFDYIVSKRALPMDEARKYFQQLISALSYCHSNGITHRDLKPENLLLTKTFEIKVADFGLSNVIEDGHFLRTSCGSPNYAAPEVIAGHVYFGPEVDIWSSGVILYALLTGTLPFDDENLGGLFKRIKSGYFQIPPFLKADIKNLISTMLIVDPLKRASLDDIQDNPWFKEKLPAYLSFSHSKAGTDKKLDYEIIDDVINIMSSEDFVRKWGKEGVLYAIKSNTANEIKSLYHMLLDRKLNDERINKQNDDISGSNKVHNYSEDSLMVALNQRDVEHSRSSVRMRIDSTDVDLPPHTSSAVDSFTASNIMSTSPFARNCARSRAPLDHLNREYLPALPPEPKKRRWFLGIQSKKEPQFVVKEVFRVIRSMKAQWHVNPKVPFRITCKWPNTNPLTRDKSEFIYLRLQLFKVQSSICLLDFQLLGKGCSVYQFNEICANFISCLRPPAPVQKVRMITGSGIE